MTTSKPSRRLPACLILLCLGACGRAQQAESPATQAPEESSGLKSDSATSEPQTLAEAEELLERARQDLDRLSLNEPGAPPATAAGAPSPPAPAPAAEPRNERAEKAADAAEAAPPRA